jgi:hypothetical protein
MKTLTFLKPANPDLTAAQPRVILQVLEAKFGANVAVTFEELGHALAKDPAFVSKQDPTLVIAYYAKRLADAGYVTYEISVEPEEPVAPNDPDAQRPADDHDNDLPPGVGVSPIFLPDVPGEVEKYEAAMHGTCVICSATYDDHGHNAVPVAEGYCCTACHTGVVLPARLALVKPAILRPEVPGGVEMEPIDTPAEFKDEAKPKSKPKTKKTKTKTKTKTTLPSDKDVDDYFAAQQAAEANEEEEDGD